MMSGGRYVMTTTMTLMQVWFAGAWVTLSGRLPAAPVTGAVLGRSGWMTFTVRGMRNISANVVTKDGGIMTVTTARTSV